MSVEQSLVDRKLLVQTTTVKIRKCASKLLRLLFKLSYKLNIGFDIHYLPILDVNYDVVQILSGHSFGQLNQSLVKVCEVLVGRFHDGNSAVGKQLLHFRFDRIEVARQQVRLCHISSMQSKGENFTEILLYL